MNKKTTEEHLKNRAMHYTELWNKFRIEHADKKYSSADLLDAAKKARLPYGIKTLAVLKEKGILLKYSNKLWRFNETEPIHYSVILEIITWQYEYDKKRRTEGKTTSEKVPYFFKDRAPLISIGSFTDAELATELRSRGYELTAVKMTEL